MKLPLILIAFFLLASADARTGRQSRASFRTLNSLNRANSANALDVQLQNFIGARGKLPQKTLDQLLQTPGNQGNTPEQNAFNNFCQASKLPLAQGSQQKTPTCSRMIQGVLPSFDRMTSTVIMSPANAAVLPRGKAVTVQVKTNNLDLGFFDDPNSQYYLSPQTVNNQGIIEGHQHVSVQRLGNPGGQVVNPPDARTEALAFFKGLNDDSANGILSVEIPADRLGAPGIYRICTITGTRGHQPVLMPVAQRGSQDDCIRVTVN